MNSKEKQIKRQLAHNLKKLIVVRDDIYPRQADNGNYYKIEEKLSTRVIERHLHGSETVGSYQFKDGNLVKSFCFDLDINKQAINKIIEKENLSLNDIFNRYKGSLIKKAKLIQNRAAHYSIRLLPEFSGNKGIHLWGFCDGFIDATKIRIVMKGILRDIDNLIENEFDDFHIDLFPAQDSVGEGIGNFVKFPCGIHKKTSNRCQLLNDDYEISDYSFESQFWLINSFATGEGLVTEDNIESLQEEFILDELPVHEHIKRLELTEQTIAELTLSASKVDRIFNNCQMFSGMEKTAKETGYLTHAQRLVLAYSMNELGKSGREKFESILKLCDDYNPDITHKNLSNIKKKRYKPFGCKKLLQPHIHNNNKAVCSLGGLCANIKAINGFTPNSFTFTPKTKTALKIKEDADKRKEQNEQLTQIELIISESNINLAWKRVKNSIQNEVWYDPDDLKRYNKFLQINLSLLSMKMEHLIGKAIPFNDYELIKVRKHKDKDIENDSFRPIAVMRLEDHIMGQAIINVIAPLYDNGEVFHPNSFGNRIIKEYETAPNNLRYWDGQWGKYSSKITQSILKYPFHQFFKIDMARYYESIPHDKLIQIFADEKYAVEENVQIWLNSLILSFKYSQKNKKQEKGIPQGPEFTHIIANIYLNKFDQWIDEKYGDEIVEHFRYVDDIYVLLLKDSNKELILNDITRYLDGTMGLTVNGGKTKSGYNYKEGNLLLNELNKVKYRIGREIRHLVGSEKDPTEEEIQHIQNLIKSMISFESDTDIDEILPHLNFASRALFNLGSDLTSIKTLLLENLNSWNPSTFNLKFLLKLLLDIYSEKPDKKIRIFFIEEIDSYRRLLTLELIREVYDYKGFDENEILKEMVIDILNVYKNGKHHLVRGFAISLLSKLKLYLDRSEWKEIMGGDGTTDYERRSLISHIVGFPEAYCGPYYNTYYDFTIDSIPAGVSAALSFSDSSFTGFSTSLSIIPDIQKNNKKDWIWDLDNSISVVYVLFANLQILGNKNLYSKSSHIGIINNILNEIPHEVAQKISRALVLYIPEFIQSQKWDTDYYLSLYEPLNLNEFSNVLKDAIHELLITAPTVTNDDLKKRLKLFGETANDEIMLKLLERVKSKELEIRGFFPKLESSNMILTNENRIVQQFKDKESGDMFIHERFPLSNAIFRSTLNSGDEILKYIDEIREKNTSPIIETAISEVFGKQYVSILYHLSKDDNFLSNHKIANNEKLNYTIIKSIESLLDPFILNRSGDELNLPHIHPFSIIYQSASNQYRVIMIGSLFDTNVYYFSAIDSFNTHSESFSGSSVYFNLGFLSFELYTDANPKTAWDNAKIKRENNEYIFLSDDDLLDGASSFYKYSWLKKLCNVNSSFRKIYNPSKEPDLFIEKLLKLYEKTSKAIDEIYESQEYIVIESDKIVVEYLALLDMSVRELEPNWSKNKKKYDGVIQSFLDTFKEFMMKAEVNWVQVEPNLNFDKVDINFATNNYIQLADEFENFLCKSHKIYTHRLHDTYFYPVLFYYQAVKNEIYCLFTAFLDKADMRVPNDELRDFEVLDYLYNMPLDDVMIEFDKAVTFTMQKSFNKKRVISALHNLFGAGKDVFDNFYINDLNTIAGLLIYLTGRVKFSNRTDNDKTLDFLKKSIPIEEPDLRALIGNLTALEKKTEKINKSPNNVNQDDFQYIIQITKDLITTSCHLNPVEILKAQQPGIINEKDDEIQIKINKKPKLSIHRSKIIYPAGHYEMIYSGEIGVGMLNDEISYLNPCSHRIEKVLLKINQYSKSIDNSLMNIQESNEHELRNLLNQDFFNLEVRKRKRDIMGEDKKIIVQRADQIINVGDNATLNTGSVVQNIQHVNEEREVQAESSEIQTVEVDENRCSHKAYFELNNTRVALVVEGAGYNPTLGDNESKIYQYLRALAPYSKCGCPNKDCEFNEVSASMEYKTDEEALKRVRGNITKIRTYKKRKIRKTLSDMNLGITPEELFITPESEHGTGGYRLHEDFCIEDLTEKKVPDEE